MEDQSYKIYQTNLIKCWKKKKKKNKTESKRFWDLFSLERWGVESYLTVLRRLVAGKGAVCLRRREKVMDVWHLCSFSPQGCWSHHIFKVNKSAWTYLFNIPLPVRALQHLPVRDLNEWSIKSFGNLFYFLFWSLFSVSPRALVTVPA